MILNVQYIFEILQIYSLIPKDQKKYIICTMDDVRGHFFIQYLMVSSLEIIDIGNTGNLKVKVVLITCISNAGNQLLMQTGEWNLNLNSLLVTRQMTLFHQGVTETSSQEVNTPNHPKHFKTIPNLDTHKPDIVSGTESWLMSNHLDSEIFPSVNRLHPF